MLAKIIIEMIRKSNKLELFNALCSFSSLIVNLAEVLLLTIFTLVSVFSVFLFLFFFFPFWLPNTDFLRPTRFHSSHDLSNGFFLPQIYMQFMQRKERGGEGGGKREEREDREKIVNVGKQGRKF